MDLERILSDLRSERDRIIRAIAALGGSGTGTVTRRGPGRKPKAVSSSSSAGTGKRRGGGLTAAGRKRLSEAMKRRWAERRKKAQ